MKQSTFELAEPKEQSASFVNFFNHGKGEEEHTASCIARNCAYLMTNANNFSFDFYQQAFIISALPYDKVNDDMFTVTNQILLASWAKADKIARNQYAIIQAKNVILQSPEYQIFQKQLDISQEKVAFRSPSKDILLWDYFSMEKDKEGEDAVKIAKLCAKIMQAKKVFTSDEYAKALAAATRSCNCYNPTTKMMANQLLMATWKYADKVAHNRDIPDEMTRILTSKSDFVTFACTHGELFPDYEVVGQLREEVLESLEHKLFTNQIELSTEKLDFAESKAQSSILWNYYATEQGEKGKLATRIADLTAKSMQSMGIYNEDSFIKTLAEATEHYHCTDKLVHLMALNLLMATWEHAGKVVSSPEVPKVTRLAMTSTKGYRDFAVQYNRLFNNSKQYE